MSFTWRAHGDNSEQIWPLHLSEALPHDVDVLDVEEDKLNILVIVLALVATTFQPVRISIHLITIVNMWIIVW